MTESTQSRLGRFTGSQSIKLFTGLKGPTETVKQWIKEKSHRAYQSRPSDYLSEESGKTFAALVLADFLHATANR